MGAGLEDALEDYMDDGALSMTEDSDPTACPECGNDIITTAVRQYNGRPGVVDVGWKCLTCGHQWGFEG